MSFAVRRLGNREQAEDAVQETLLVALESAHRFSGASALATWLVGILKHKIIDALRRSSREEPLDYHDAIGHDSDPESELARRRAVRAVDARLKQISSCAARVFVLRAVMGMDTAEVCRQLGISPSNCWVLHHRVRRELSGSAEIRDAL